MLRLGNSFIQNPHPTYEQMRLQGPAQPVMVWGGVRVWMVTRYDEARALLADPTVKKDGPTATRLFPPGTDGSIGSVLGDNMLFKDPPDHTRLRRFVTAAFTAHSVKRLRPTVVRVADELLDAIGAQGNVDLMQAYAQPLPVRVIGELLGVPPVKQDTFLSLVIPIFTSTQHNELRTAQTELTALLQTIIAAKRSAPGDDVLSSLVHHRDHGDQLSEQELLGTAFLLIVAGYDTTVNLIGNGILALLEHPDQLRAVRADRTLLLAAVEETLRYESPLNTATVRFTTDHPGRQRDSFRRTAVDRAARRQSRRAAFHGTPSVRRVPTREPAHRIRTRHPPLRRRAAGQDGRGGRAGPTAHPLRRHPTGGHRPADIPPEHVDAWPAGTAGEPADRRYPNTRQRRPRC